MSKRVSPAQAANRVLKAFPYARAGVEISAGHVAEFFRRHAYEVSDVVAGVHYAISLGWIERADINSLRLTSKGAEKRDFATVATVPPSTFQAWAHPQP